LRWACGCGIELLGAAGIGAGDLGAIAECVEGAANWLMYSGNYAGHRFQRAGSDQYFECGFAGAQVGVPDDGRRKFETTPLVVDGVLYGTGQEDRMFALDAKSGRPIWQYQRALPADIKPCCGRVNRGFAILGDKVFAATLDAHVIALDSRRECGLDVESAEHGKGYSYTLAPLLIKSLVLVGVSGGEYAFGIH